MEHAVYSHKLFSTAGATCVAGCLHLHAACTCDSLYVALSASVMMVAGWCLFLLSKTSCMCCLCCTQRAYDAGAAACGRPPQRLDITADFVWLVICLCVWLCCWLWLCRLGSTSTCGVACSCCTTSLSWSTTGCATCWQRSTLTGERAPCAVCCCVLRASLHALCALESVLRAHSLPKAATGSCSSSDICTGCQSSTHCKIGSSRCVFKTHSKAVIPTPDALLSFWGAYNCFTKPCTISLLCW